MVGHLTKNLFSGLALCKQIENVPQHAAVGLVEFSVLTARAGDMGEFLVLEVEEFTEKATCGADLAGLVRGIAAFGAHEIYIFAHFLVSLFFDLIILRFRNIAVQVFF